MKALKLVSAFFILTTLTMSFVKWQDWYLCQTKYCKVLFPKKPAASAQTINSPIGALKLNLNIYEVPANEQEKEDNFVYLLNETEYPDSVINSNKKDKLDKFFRQAIDGAVNNVHGKLLSEKMIAINQFPGREIRVDFQNGKDVIKMRMYLVRNRMFMVETVTDTKKDFNKSINKFMDSFTLIN